MTAGEPTPQPNPTRVTDDSHAFRLAWRVIRAQARVIADFRAGRARMSYTATEEIRNTIPRLENYLVDRAVTAQLAAVPLPDPEEKEPTNE